MKTDLNTPQNRNFMKWNILGRYTWLNPWPYPATYPEQISSLKTWIHNRLLWLDNNLPNPNVIGIEEWDSNETISYSNPIENGKLLIQCKSHPTETVFTLMDYKGNKLYQYEIKIDTDQFEIPIVTQTPGLYLALLQTNTDTHTLKIIVK